MRRTATGRRESGEGRDSAQAGLAQAGLAQVGQVLVGPVPVELARVGPRQPVFLRRGAAVRAVWPSCGRPWRWLYFW